MFYSVRFKQIVLAILLVAVEAVAQPRYLSLTQNINLRVRTTHGQTQYLRSIGTLPAGTVIAVDTENFNRPLGYLYGNDLRSSRFGFVQGIKILKVPGMSPSQVSQLNRYALHMSANELRTSRVVQVQFQSSQTRETTGWSRLFRSVPNVNQTAVQRANAGLGSVQSLNRNQTCTNCSPGYDARYAAQGAPQSARQNVSTPAQASAVGNGGRASLSGYGLAASCSHFMDKNGSVGAWGRDVISIISQPAYRSSYFGSNALGRLCPGFGRMSEEKKTQAWVWFWASLADEESGCNPQIVHPTHDKRGNRINRVEGYGLFAIERNPHDREHRGAACRSVGTAAQQTLCAVDTMQKHHFQKGYTAYRSSGSYWGPIHRADAQIIPHMRRFQGCF